MASVLAGPIILWIFKFTSNQRALHATRRRVISHLLAMRLFPDDPRMIVRSQGRLLAWNARYLALLFPPFLAIAVPMWFAWSYLDALWGHAPFTAGESTVITAHIARGGSEATLSAPPWIAIESPAVHAVADGEVSWRVRVRERGAGDITIHAGTVNVARRIDATPGLHYLPDRTKAQAPVEWLEIRYPRARIQLAGIAAGWAVWFFAISTLSALALRRTLRVTI